MIDWIAGHTDRFKALVTHDGVFDLVDVRRDRGAVVPGVGARRAVWSHPEGYAR